MMTMVMKNTFISVHIPNHAFRRGVPQLPFKDGLDMSSVARRALDFIHEVLGAKTSYR